MRPARSVLARGDGAHGAADPGHICPGADLATDTEKAAVFATALASNAPVLLLPGDVAQRFGIRRRSQSRSIPRSISPISSACISARMNGCGRSLSSACLRRLGRGSATRLPAF
jgi:hypothetical protein